jgi:hypothetical protein
VTKIATDDHEGRTMKGFRSVTAFFCVNAMLLSAALAARLATSTMVVHVLSVTEEFHHREAARFGPQIFDTAGFVARVQIQTVLQTDHGLVPDETIDIHYQIRTAKPLPLGFHDKPLQPGEDATVMIMETRDGYERR